MKKRKQGTMKYLILMRIKIMTELYLSPNLMQSGKVTTINDKIFSGT